MDKSQGYEELIDRYLLGMADEADVKQLDALLEVDEASRHVFLAASRLDSYLREQAIEQPAMESEESCSVQKLRFTWFNPGVAAGLLIGLFSASLVWAYAIPQGKVITRTDLITMSESFENSDMQVLGFFPFKAKQWFGQLVSVYPEGGVSPVEGQRVGELIPLSGKRTAFVRYLLDLSDYPDLVNGHERSLDVVSSFFSQTTEQVPKFRVELTAFSQGPDAVKSVCHDRENFDERVLQVVQRNYNPQVSKQAGWHEVSATLEIPQGSRSVLISLGFWHLNPEIPVAKYYLDAVKVRLGDIYDPQG